MRRLLLLLTTFASASLAPAAILVPVHEAIPDGDLAGLASVVTVSGQVGTVQDLAVTLHISGTYNGDLYAYLTRGSGFSILLNRPGRSESDSLGYGDDGLMVTLSDAAPADSHTYGGSGGGLWSGTYQPDGRQVLPSDVVTTSARIARFGSFRGLDPNGEWVLFVADVEGGDVHELVSWSLEFGAIPEPAGWWLGTLPLLLLARHWRQRPADIGTRS